MYCPVCFNASLKPSSSGVLKMTFNKKSRATSQMHYNTNTESPMHIYKQLQAVMEDYLSWYSEFQNIDPINEIEVISSDYKCSNGCQLNMNHRINSLDDFLDKNEVLRLLKESCQKFNIPCSIKKL